MPRNHEIESAPSIYLEDLHIGQRFISGELRIDADQIKAFAAEFDPQAFHLDENRAQAGVDVLSRRDDETIAALRAHFHHCRGHLSTAHRILPDIKLASERGFRARLVS